MFDKLVGLVDSVLIVICQVVAVTYSGLSFLSDSYTLIDCSNGVHLSG